MSRELSSRLRKLEVMREQGEGRVRIVWRESGEPEPQAVSGERLA